MQPPWILQPRLCKEDQRESACNLFMLTHRMKRWKKLFVVYNKSSNILAHWKIYILKGFFS